MLPSTKEERREAKKRLKEEEKKLKVCERARTCSCSV